HLPEARRAPPVRSSPPLCYTSAPFPAARSHFLRRVRTLPIGEPPEAERICHAPRQRMRVAMRSPESLSSHKVQAYLAAREVVPLAAVGPDGGPWATPMWFLPTSDAIFMISVDGLPKVKSLQRDPRVAVVAETTSSDGAIQGVTVRGRVEFLQDSAER